MSMQAEPVEDGTREGRSEDLRSRLRAGTESFGVGGVRAASRSWSMASR